MMCLGVGFFASILNGTLCASWTCKSVSFTKLGKFSFIIFSNRFPISCSFSSPSGKCPMRQMLHLLKLSQRLFILSSSFWILFSSCCFAWFFASLGYQIIGLILSFIHSPVVSLKIILYFNYCILCFWIDLFYAVRSSLSSLSIL